MKTKGSNDRRTHPAANRCRGDGRKRLMPQEVGQAAGDEHAQDQPGQLGNLLEHTVPGKGQDQAGEDSQDGQRVPEEIQRGEGLRVHGHSMKGGKPRNRNSVTRRRDPCMSASSRASRPGIRAEVFQSGIGGLPAGPRDRLETAFNLSSNAKQETLVLTRAAAEPAFWPDGAE